MHTNKPRKLDGIYKPIYRQAVKLVWDTWKNHPARIPLLILSALVTLSSVSPYLLNPSPTEAATASTGMLVYSIDANTTPKYRDWSTTDLGTESSLQAEEANHGETYRTVLKAAPNRDEYIYAAAAWDATDTHLDVQVWTGGAWANGTNAPANGDFTTTLADSAAGTENWFQPFDVAYEAVSGEGIVFYENSSTSTDAVFAYRTWDGSSWSNEVTYTYSYTGATTGEVRWIRAEPIDDSNQIAVVFSDSNSDLGYVIWDGSAMNTANDHQITATLSTASHRAFDIAEEGLSGDIGVAYGTGTTVDFCSASSDLTTCVDFNDANLVNPGDGAMWLELAGDLDTNNIALAVSDTNNSMDLNVDMFNGTNWSSSSPTEEATIEEGSADDNTQAFDVAWETGTGTTDDRAIFVFSDLDGTTIDYFAYDISASGYVCPENSQSVTALGNAEGSNGPCNNATHTFADDISQYNLVPSPTDNRIMLTAYNNITTAFRPEQLLWNDTASTWTQTTNQSNFTTDLSPDVWTTPASTDNQPQAYAFAWEALSLTISGRVFTDEGTTGLDCTTPRVVRIKVNGGGTYSTNCNNTGANGSYSIGSIVLLPGAVVSVFLDGASEKASTTTIMGSSNVTDMHLYIDRVILRSEGTDEISSVHLNLYDNGADTDMLYTVTGAAFTVDSGKELHIWSGDTYNSSTDTTTASKVHVAGTYSSGNSLTITGTGTGTSRPLYIDGGTMTTAPTDIYFTGAGNLEVDSGVTYNNLNLQPTSGTETYTLGTASSQTLTINGNLTVNNGATLTIEASTYNITINLAGNLTLNTGTTWAKSNNAFGFKPSGTKTITDNNSTKQNIGWLNLSGGTATPQLDLGSSIVATQINVAASHTLNANGTKTITLTGNNGSGTFSISGTFTESTSTVAFTNDANTTMNANNAESSTFNNLEIIPTITADRTYTFGTTALTVNGNLTINPTASSTTKTLTVNLGSAATIHTTSTTTIQGTGTGVGVLDVRPASTDYNLTSGRIAIGAGGKLDGTSSSSAITATSLTGTLFTLNSSGDFIAGTTTVNLQVSTGTTPQLTSGQITSTDAFYDLVFQKFVTGGSPTSFTVNDNTIEATGNLTIQGGGVGELFTYNAGGHITVASNKTLTISTDALLDLRPSTTDYNLTTGLLNIDTTGTLDAGGSSSVITLTGTSGTLFTNSGTFTEGSSEVVVTSASGTPTLLSAAETFHKLTINSSATVINAGANITTNNTAGNIIYVQSGVFNFENRTITAGTNATLQLGASATLCLDGRVAATNATCNNSTASSNNGMPSFSTYSFDPSSTVRYIGNAAGETVSTINGSAYGNLEFEPETIVAGDVSFTSAGALLIDGNLSVIGGEYGNFTFNPAGNITVAATKTTTITGGSVNNAIIDLRPSTTDYNLTTGALSVGSTGVLDAAGAASAINIAGNYTNNGTFTAGSSTVTFADSSGTKTLSGTMTGSSAFNHIVFNGTGDTWNVNNALTANGNYTMTAGTVVQGANIDMTLYGDVLLSSGTIFTKASGTGKFIMDGDATTETFTDSTSPQQDLGAVQIGLSPGTTNLSSDMTATSLTIPTGDRLNTRGYEVTLSSFFDAQGTAHLDTTDTGAGAYEGNGSIITVAGNWTFSGTGTFTLDTDAGTPTKNVFNGTADQTITTGGKTFYQVEINNTGAGGSDDLIISGALDINGAFTITDGDLDTNTNDINTNVAHDFTIAANGSIDAGTGTWTFDPTGTKTWTDSSSSKWSPGLVTIGSGASTPQINLGSSVEASTMTIATSHTLNLQSSGYTLDLIGTGAASTVLTVTGTLTPGTNSTVKYSATNSGGTVTVAATTYRHLQLSGTETYDLGANLTGANAIPGNLTIDSGAILDAVSGSNFNIELAGNYSNSGTFTARSGTVTLNGSTTQTMSGTMTTTSAFNTLTITNNSGTSASDNERTGFVASVDFDAAATATNYNITTANVRVEYNSGSTYTFTNINWNGAATGTRIYFRNSAAGSGTWLLNVSGTQTDVSYVNVSRSDASSGSTIDASNGTNFNATNNTNWNFVSSITISGTCDQYDQTTDCTDDGGNQIAVAINGSLQAQVDTVVDGAWQISGVTNPSTGDIITIFIDGETTDNEEAVAVTKYDGTGNITGVVLYWRHLTIGSGDNQTLANADIDAYDNSVSADEDIFFEVNGTDDLTVDTLSSYTDEEIYIVAGNSYRPASGGGGDANTMHVEIDGTWTADSNTINVDGNWQNDGTFTANTSTANFNSSSGGRTLSGTMTGATGKFNDIVFNNVGGAWALSAAIEAGNDFTVTNGSVTTNNNTVTVGRDFTLTNNIGTLFTAGSSTINVVRHFNDSAGTKFVEDTSTVNQTGTGTITVGNGGDFNNLSIGYSSFTTTFSNNNWDIFGTITFNGGTVTGGGSYINLRRSTTGSSITFGSATTLNGTMTIYHTSGAASFTYTITGGNYGTWGVVAYAAHNSVTYSLGGNITSTGYIRLEADDAVTGSAFNTSVTNYSISTGYFHVAPCAPTRVGPWAIDFNDSSVSLTSTTNSLYVGSNCGSHTLDLDTSDVTVNGSVLFVSGTGTISITPGTSDFTFAPSASQTETYASNAQSLWNMVINGANGAATIQPTAAVDVNNNFTITAGTYDTVSGSNYALTIGNNYSNSGTFTAQQGTVTFDATDTGNTLGGTMTGASAFFHLTFAGSGGEWTPSAAVTATRDLTMTNGSLLGSQNITVNGHVQGTSGTINLTGGTFEQRLLTGGLAKNFGATSGSTAWTFNDLTFSNGCTICAGGTITTQTGGSGGINISGVLRIGKSGDGVSGTTTLNAGNRTWTLSGTGGDPFQILASPAGDLSPSTSTFTYTGNNGGGDTTVQSETFNNLIINNGSETFNLEGTTQGVDVTITAGTLAIGSNTLTATDDLTVDGTLSGTGNVNVSNDTVGTGIVTLTGGTLSTIGSAGGNFGTTSGSNSWTFNNVTFYENGDQGGMTITTQTGGSGGITISGVLTVGDASDGTGTTLNAGNRTWTLSGTGGDPFQLVGTAPNLVPSTSTFAYTGNNPSSWTMIQSEQYHHLQVNNGSELYVLESNTSTDEGGDLTISAGTFDLNSAPYGMTIGGSYTNNGNFESRTGTVTFSSTSSGRTLNGQMTGASDDFYDLVFNGVGGAWTFNAAAATANDFTVTNGAVTANGNNLTVSRDFTLANTTGVSYVAGSTTVTVDNNWNDLGGKFSAGTSTVTLTGTGTLDHLNSFAFHNLNLAPSGFVTTLGTSKSTRVSNDATLNGGTLTGNSSTLEFPQTATNTPLTFNSPTTLNGTGFNIIGYGANSSSITMTIGAGDYGNWNLFMFASANSVTHNFGGNVTTTGHSRLYAGGAVTGLTLNTQGFNFTSGSFRLGSGGSTQTVSANFGASAVTFTDSADTIDTETTGGTYNLDLGSSVVDTKGNVLFAEGSGSIAVTPGTSTLKWTHTSGTKTYAPNGQSLYNMELNASGGTVQPTAAVDVNNNFTITAGTYDTVSGSNYALTVGGNYSNSGTFTARSGTVTFDATDAGNTLTGSLDTASGFFNLIFNGSGGDWTPNAAVGVYGSLTMTAGTLLGTQNVTVYANVAGTAGVINLTGGTFEQKTEFTNNFGTTSGSVDWTFNDLTFSHNGCDVPGTATVTTQTGGTGGINVGGVLRIGKSGDNPSCPTALDAGNRTWTLSGTGGDPFQLLASPAGNLIPSTSTFAYTGNNGGGNTTIQSETYNHLTVNNGTETYVLEGATGTGANGNITITAGTLDVTGSNHALTIGGNYLNSGSFTAQNGTVTFTATDTGNTLSGTMTGGSAFYNLIFNGSGGEWTPSAAVAVSNDLTMTTGTLLGTQNVTVNGAVAGTAGVINLTGGAFEQRVSAAKNFGTTSGTTAWTFNDLTFSNGHASTGYTVTTQTGGTGAITVTGILRIGKSGDAAGATTNLDAGNRSWTLSGTGGDPFQILASPAGALTANTSTFLYTGNNGGGDTTVQSATYYTLRVQATEIYLPEGSVTTNNTIRVDGSATYTLNSQTSNATGGVTVDGTLNGSGTLQSGSDIKGTGTITITSGDTILRTSAAASFGNTSGGGPNWTFDNLKFENASASDRTITVFDSKTHIVNGTMTIGNAGDTNRTVINNNTWDGTFDINGNVLITSKGTFQASNTTPLTVGGNWQVDSGGIFTANSNTVTLDATDAGNTLSGDMTGSSAFYNLTFNGSGGEWTPSAAIAATNDLTMTAGTLLGTQNITVNGHVAGTAGVINLTGGTFEQRVSAAKNFGTTSGSTAWTFNDLTFSNGHASTPYTITTQTGGTGSITVSGILRIGKSGDAAGATTTLNAGNRTWTLSGTGGDPFQILASPAGDLTPSTSTFTFTGNNGGGDTTIQNETYNNLVINNGSETYNLEGATLGTDITITAGVLALNGQTLNASNDLTTNGTLSGSTNVTVNGSVLGTGTVNLSGGTFTQRITANANETFGTTSGSNNWTFSNLIFRNSDTNNHSITINSTGSGQIIVDTAVTFGSITDTNTVTVDFDTNDRILDVNGSVDITTLGIFEPSSSASFTVGNDWTNNGAFNHNNGTVTFDTTATATIVGSTTFYNFTSTTAAKTLEFEAEKTFTIDTGGVLTLTGAADPNEIQIKSTTSTQWLINHQGTESVSYVQVINSGCEVGSTDITTSNSINDGNNGTCWKFNSVFSQEDYRFGQPNGLNIDYTGAPAENTAYTTAATGDDFRLRMLVHVADTQLDTSAKNFKLQYGEKTAANCTTGVSWGDVQAGSGVIRYYDGGGRTDGDNLTTNGGDPTAGHTVVAQDYEEANNFTNSVAAIPAGQDGLWDFSLVNNSAVGGKRYCFRAVESDGTVFANGYAQYPEVIVDEELVFSLDATSKNFGVIQPGDNPTNQTSTVTVSTNAATGYVVYAWATQAMTKGSHTIPDWGGTNASPTLFPNGSFGFGYSTNDLSLTGGTADRFDPGGGGAPRYAGFVNNGPGDPVADRTSGPVSNQVNTITYRLASGVGQQAGTYTTVIVYVVATTF